MRIVKLFGMAGAAALLAAAVSIPAHSAEMANTQLKDASGKVTNLSVPRRLAPAI